jgi:hypothetical protein
MRFYDVPVNRSVLTEANRGLTSYTVGASEKPPVCTTAIFSRGHTPGIVQAISHVVSGFPKRAGHIDASVFCPQAADHPLCQIHYNSIQKHLSTLL